MSTESISDKVKKLLRLARCEGATPAEAANALNRALELIEKHQIDVASLDLDADTENIVSERIFMGARMSRIKHLVASILINFFPVKLCVAKPDLVIVGFEQDVTIAGYVFHFLVGACTRAVKQYGKMERLARRRITANKKASFIQGWMYGVASNLRKKDQSGLALEDSKAALVLTKRSQRVDAHYEELFPRTKKIALADRRKNESAMAVGWREGKSTTINQPLANSPQGTLLLT